MLVYCDRLQPHHAQVVKVVLVVDPHVLPVLHTLRLIGDVRDVGPFAVEESALEQLKNTTHTVSFNSCSPQSVSSILKSRVYMYSTYGTVSHFFLLLLLVVTAATPSVQSHEVVSSPLPLDLSFSHSDRHNKHCFLARLKSVDHHFL